MWHALLYNTIPELPMKWCKSTFMLRHWFFHEAMFKANDRKCTKNINLWLIVRQEVLIWTFCRGSWWQAGNVRQRCGPLRTGYWGWSRPRHRPSCRQIAEHVVMGAGERDKKRERGRESGSEEERRHGKEGVVMLLRERTKEKKKRQDNRTTNKPMCLSSPRRLWMR